MSCQDIIEFLADYAAGAVTVQERTIFESHLAICPPCVAYLRTYQAAVQLGKTALSETTASDPIPDELVAAILAARRDATETA